MRYIENYELREWVKDNLKKTIFQKVTGVNMNYMYLNFLWSRKYYTCRALDSVRIIELIPVAILVTCTYENQFLLLNQIYN